MKNNTHLTRRAGLLTLLIALASPMIEAAEKTPIKMIVPASAGSGLDITLRAAVSSMTKALDGQAIVVDNQAGAGGITGTANLVKAMPDGLTLGFISNNHAVNPSVYKKMPFDSVNDITPISVIGSVPFVLVVPSKLPVKTARELQSFLKAKPGAYNYSSSGNGTIIHLAGAQFVDSADVDVKHVPYKGMAPMVNDLLGGVVEFGVIAVPVALPHLKSGALRALGVLGKQRVRSIPDIPSMTEQGFPDVDIGGWFALVGPAKLPAAEVKRLHGAVLAAFAMPEAVEAMNKQENVIHPMTPEASARFIRSEVERYARLVQKAAVTLD